MLFSILFASHVYAAPIPAEFRWIEPHGPDKPSPDEGYEFKKKKTTGGNLLAKFGVLIVGIGGFSAARSIVAEDPAQQQTYQKRAAVLMGSGVGLIVIEKLR